MSFPHLQQLRFRTDSRYLRPSERHLRPLVRCFPHLHSLDLDITVDAASLLQLCALVNLRTLSVDFGTHIDERAAGAFSAHPTFQRLCIRRAGWMEHIVSHRLGMLHSLATSRSWRTLAFIGVGPTAEGMQRQLEELPRRTNISPELKAQLQQSPFRFEIWDERELNCTVLLLWPREDI